MRALSGGRQPGTDSADRLGPLRVPVRLVIRTIILAGLAVGLSYNLWGFPGVREFGSYYRLDLDVYRLGGSAFLHGPALYGDLPATQLGNHLPFTYPPLAAVLFSPLSSISLESASLLLTGLSLIALFGALVVTLDSLGIRPRTTLIWTALGALALALALEPVSSTLDYGQINLLLMVLVTADCLPRKTPWPRGVLIGLAAAIKLTPAVFILYFLVRKDFRATLVTAVSFLAFSVLGAVATWHDSVTYWTEILFDSDRIGTPAYPANQSITGALARLGLSDSVRTTVWALLSAVVLALAILAMIGAVRAGERALALGLNAALGLLISPVSWSHHWVWAVPIILTLGLLAWRRASITLALTAVVGLVVVKLAAHWKLGVDRWDGTGWSLWDQFLASSYVWWGLVFILVSLFVFGRRTPDSEGTDPTRTTESHTVPVG